MLNYNVFKIYLTIKSSKDYNLLQPGIVSVQGWYTARYMKINIIKL
jgi:hypothetical protein